MTKRDDAAELRADIETFKAENAELGMANLALKADAAELRAALVKMADLVYTIASADEELSFPHYEDSERTQAYLQLHRAVRKAAWESLQELAAEYDGVPALAATEGSEP